MALQTADATLNDKLDAEMREVLEAWQAMGPRPLQDLSPEEARHQPMLTDAVAAVLRARGKDPRPPGEVATRDFSIPGPIGELPARLYGPATDKPDAAQKPLPVAAYWHGGGWALGDLETGDRACRAIARMADCIVVSCGYRLAPEHKFPAQQMDALAAYAWLLENAADFGGDPRKVAVMGESAGGNLAANVAIMARDAREAAAHPGLGEHGLVKRQPIAAPVHMALIYPVAGVDMATPSYLEHGEALPLDRASMGWFLDQATETDGDRTDPRLDLVSADLHGLPDGTVILAELDPLRSEGEALAKALKDAGSDVREHTFKGLTHGFFGLGAVVKKAFAAEELVAHNLKRAFGAARLPI